MHHASAPAGEDTFAKQYVIFDTDAHVRSRPFHGDWTLDHLVADVISVLPRTRALRFLQHPLPGLPVLQVAVTQRDAGPLDEAVPGDFRDVEGLICTCYL